MSSAARQGIDVGGVTRWFAEHVPEAVPPLSFDLVAGGHSNLTFLVTDGSAQRYVLRRPPLHQVLATAHDMEREHRIMAALASTAVPVPVVRGLCLDPAVNERPFYVMDFVDGLVVRSGHVAAGLADPVRRAASVSLVEVLAAIHQVDPDAVGLGELGKREDYVGRQLRRWMRQYEDSKTAERPIVAELHAQLAAAIPAQGQAGIVHGDYRLDNCIIGPGGAVVAVLDWELCTLGEPLVDLAQLLVYWAEPGDETIALIDPPTGVGGFATKAELVDRYAALTGREVADLDYYLAFSSWRLGCILEGVYSRYRNGAMGEVVPSDLDEFARRVDGLFASAARHAAAVS